MVTLDMELKTVTDSKYSPGGIYSSYSEGYTVGIVRGYTVVIVRDIQ